jgi:hypothetical protein
MKETFYDRIGESVWRETLPNGLRVCVVPKPEHAKKYAFFATRYGGMDVRFRQGETWLDTPPGIAHYLEHKMFDTKEGNALQELAKNGAEPNAFTSSGMTCYYFESTQKFYDNLRLLLKFVSTPYFTPESVAKEQGIIGQEIRMTEDRRRSWPWRSPVPSSSRALSAPPPRTARTTCAARSWAIWPAIFCWGIPVPSTSGFTPRASSTPASAGRLR